MEQNIETYFQYYASPLGRMILESDGEALTGLRFERPGARQDAPAAGKLPVFAETARWLDLYFGGEDPGFTPEIRLRGSAFRQAVWAALCTVPYGTTTTYGEIAALAAEQLQVPRMSAQAVGGAVGHNPVALIIPCHRVIGKDGSLTGYAAGLDRKQALLELEKASKKFF